MTTFHAEGIIKETVRIIKEIQHGPFGRSDRWVNESILIPSVAPSGLPYCNIINTRYSVHVYRFIHPNVMRIIDIYSYFLVQYIVESKAMPWNFACSLNLPMDIIIGTIPFTLPIAPRSNNPENSTENIYIQQQQPIDLEDRESI